MEKQRRENQSKLVQKEEVKETTEREPEAQVEDVKVERNEENNGGSNSWLWLLIGIAFAAGAVAFKLKK